MSDRRHQGKAAPAPQRVTITKVAFGGAGIATLSNGKVCFVPGTIPGETATVLITREKKSYAEGELQTLHEVSPHRVKPPCPVAAVCGGCQYQHIAYPLQLSIKQEQVREILTRIGGIPNPPVDPTAASPLEFAYRNRITVHSRGGKTGFFARGTRTVIDVKECPISSPDINRQLAGLRANKPSDGEYALRESSEFRGFRQVNEEAAKILLQVVEEFAMPGGDLLVDAFSGAGFFAKHLQDHFKNVIGIEWSADAVRHARSEAPAHVTYLHGDASLLLGSALDSDPATTTVLVDPPAEGLPQPVIDTLLERRPARLLYVSCDPATLARDIKKLSTTYELKRVSPVDMFPQTAQIECVALLGLD